VAIDAPLVHRIMKTNELLAGHGERVLAFAYRKLHSKHYPLNYVFNMDDEEQWTSDLCFLGLAGIIDPPREGVAESINTCHNAHVRVMMVTGDQPATAVAIARAVNIITHTRVKTIADVEYTIPYSADDIYEEQHENKFLSKLIHIVKAPPKRHFKDESIVVAGNEISTLTKKQWDFVLEHREVVFARTTPQQKLQIVKESRKRGDVVAVTGDGVNDAPALKAADLGVAMGICGSDVSKEAANMVLLDDNFVTIVKGIKEGRLLFNNLKKVICYLFPCGSFSEILPVLASVFLGMPMPLSTFLMIVICVGSDMIGSLGMVHELAESDIMHRPPRNARTDRLVNSRTILYAYFYIGIMESAIAFFMYFFTMWYEGGIYPSQIVLTFDKWTNETYLPGISVDRRTELNLVGQSAFFVSLVMCQLWNLLAARTRYQSIFTQKFQPKLFYYMLGEVAVVLCTVYLPVINKYIYTRPVYYYHFLIPLGLGSVILMCDEIRKLLVRKFPKGILAKLAW
jgi:sodium/potassium-transporting ATPase subunit alpha